MYIIIALLVVLAIAVIIIYNGLVNLRNLTKEAWSNIDVFLTKRHDLIPQLVNTVKGYAQHEQALFEKITALRTSAIDTQNLGEQLAIEDKITKTLGEIKVAIEKYPELKANENYLALQRQLVEMETEIERSRRYFNGCVRNMNNAVETFPKNIIANMFGFKKSKFFVVESELVRKAPSAAIATTLLFATALTLTSCGSGSIVSATKSAAKYYADRSEKNALDFSKKFAKAEADIRKLDSDAQINPDKYIKLNEKAAEIDAFSKALNLLSGGKGYIEIGGQQFQLQDYSELVNRAQKGAILAYENRGDKIMNQATASAYQYEEAMKDYEKAGDTYKAQQAKQSLINRLLSDGERGFRNNLSSYDYESALKSYIKAADYGSREGEQGYYELLDAIGMTLIVNIDNINNNTLRRLQDAVPMYVEVVVDPNMRRAFSAMRGDLVIVLEEKSNSGSYRDNDNHHQGSVLEMQLIDLRTRRNGTVIASWPVEVKYPADRSKYRSAEIDAFASAISSRVYDINRAIKDKVRVMPRNSSNYRSYNSNTWRTGSSSGTWRY